MTEYKDRAVFSLNAARVVIGAIRITGRSLKRMPSPLLAIAPVRTRRGQVQDESFSGPQQFGMARMRQRRRRIALDRPTIAALSQYTLPANLLFTIFRVGSPKDAQEIAVGQLRAIPFIP